MYTPLEKLLCSRGGVSRFSLAVQRIAYWETPDRSAFYCVSYILLRRNVDLRRRVESGNLDLRTLLKKIQYQV